MRFPTPHGSLLHRGVGALPVALTFRERQVTSPEAGRKPAIFGVCSSNTRHETRSSYTGKCKRAGGLSFLDRNCGRTKKGKSPPATPEGFSSSEIRTFRLPKIRTNAPMFPMALEFSICSVRWERYPKVSGNTHAREWLTDSKMVLDSEGLLRFAAVSSGWPTMHSELRRFQGPWNLAYGGSSIPLALLAWELAKRDCVSLGPRSEGLPDCRVAKGMS